MGLKPFEVERISLGNIIILEGTDSPENIFSQPDIPIGSIYIKYNGEGEKGFFQKTGNNIGDYKEGIKKSFMIAMSIAL